MKKEIAAALIAVEENAELLKGAKGDLGDEGPRGERGPEGPKGRTGDRGPAGERGPVGPAGKEGAAGPQGLVGPKGDPGRDGTDGRDGKNGERGDKGIQGPAGPPGKDGRDGGSRAFHVVGGAGAGGGGGGGSALEVKDEGVSLDTAVTSIDFAGTGVTATNVGHAVTVTSTAYYPGGTDVAVADGGTGASTAAAARTNLGLDKRVVNFVIDGGGSAISTGIKGDVLVPFDWRDIESASLLADQSGSIVVNVWKDSYANFPPVVGDKITASAPPTISTATKSQDTTLTGWTKTGSAGDILRFNVDSATSITRCTLCLVLVT